tara:strand:- start:772 stop:1116 length:345 start_codon:yes stop_codon:yes gene_type:complete
LALADEAVNVVGLPASLCTVTEKEAGAGAPTEPIDNSNNPSLEATTPPQSGRTQASIEKESRVCPSTFLLVCESLVGPTRLPDEREEDDTFTLLEDSRDEGHMMLSVTPLKKRP